MIVDREALIETLTKRLKDKNEQFKRRHDYRLVSRIDTTIPKTEDAASQVTANFAKKIQQANSTYYTTCNSTHTPYLTTITEHSPSKYHKRLWYSPHVRKKVISRAKKVFFDQVIFRSLTETKKVYKSIPIEERAIKHAFAVWDVDKHLNEQLHKYYHVTQHFEPIKHKPTPFQKNQTRTHLQRIIIKHKQTQNKSAHKNINFVLTPSSPVNLHHSTTYTSSSYTSTGTNTVNVMSLRKNKHNYKLNSINRYNTSNNTNNVNTHSNYISLYSFNQHQRPKSNLQCYFNNQRIVKYNQTFYKLTNTNTNSNKPFSLITTNTSTKTNN